MESFKEFDDSDWNLDGSVGDDESSSLATSDDMAEGKAIAKANTVERPQVPNHLLMVALLEHICAHEVKDKTQRHELFKLICGKLSEFNVMSPLTYMDEFSNIREQYRNSFAAMMKGAMITLQKSQTFGISFLENKNVTKFFNPGEIPRGPVPPPRNVFTMKSTRYETEFCELSPLGKGGFGNVYRVRHKLDGCEYAVKKVRFRSSNPDVCLKIMREVKVLARLTHDNIVRYNNAWVEAFAPSTSPPIPTSKEYPALEYNHSLATGIGKEASANDPGEESILFDTAASGLRQFVDSPKIVELKSRTSMEVRVDSDESLSGLTSLEGSGAVGVSDFGESSAGGASNLSGSFRKLPINDINGVDMKSPVHIIPLKRKGSDKSKEDSKKQHSEAIEESRRNRRRSGEKATGLGDPPYTNKKDLQRSLSVNGNGEKHKSESTSPQRIPSPQDEDRKRCARSYCRSRRSISFDPMVCDMCDEEYVKMERGWQLNYPFAGKIHLFIQMELCEQTLKDWMDTRNQKANSLTDRYAVVNEPNNMRIFHQILEGLAYIHQQDVIHRDIKPRNIFVNSSTLQVKIGDFGLARDLWTATMEEAYADARHGGHTKKVGTSMYAAPEQLKGSSYDAKSDVYSLGVVLYEMFQPYNTSMERVESLKNLRKGDICPISCRNWPQQMGCVADMMDVEHNKRPSTESLLMSDMFGATRSQPMEACYQGQMVENQSDEVERLRIALEDKDMVIEEQKMLLQTKDLMLEEKDKEITQLRFELLALQSKDK